MDNIALEGQSFLDIAIKAGSLEAIVTLDDSVSVTDDPIIGQRYLLEVTDRQVANYYSVYNLEPASFASPELLEQDPTGIGSMMIETNFIVA